MLTAEFRRWRRAEPGAHAPDPTAVGALSPSVLAALDARGLAPSTALVTAARRDIAHALRNRKVERGQAVSDADIDRLPEVLARPRAVLLDARGNAPVLIYVFDAPGGRAGKFVVRVRRPADRARETNRFVTAGYVHKDALRHRRYTPLDGSLD